MGQCCRAEKYRWCRAETETYTVNGEEYCIYHIPSEMRKTLRLVDEFNLEIKKYGDMGGNDYSGCEFDHETPLERRVSCMVIKECKFFYPIKFNMAFDYCDFTGASFDDVDFGNSSFKRETSFNEVIFKGKAIFENCKFLSKCSFSEVKYLYLTFENATFASDCNFSFMTRVEKETAMKFAHLGVNFTNIFVEPQYKVSFHMCSIDNAFFHTRGDGSLEFIGGDLKCVSFLDSDLSRCKFNGIDLSECFFLGAGLSETGFFDCKFREKKYLTARRILIFEEVLLNSVDDLKKRGEYGIIHEFTSRRTSAESLKETYRALKNNFESNKDYVTADEFHYSEMLMRQLLIGENLLKESQSSNKLVKKIESLFYRLCFSLKVRVFSFYPWYNYLSGFSTSYYRVLMWILVTLSTFSVSYIV